MQPTGPLDSHGFTFILYSYIARNHYNDINKQSFGVILDRKIVIFFFSFLYRLCLKFHAWKALSEQRLGNFNIRPVSCHSELFPTEGTILCHQALKVTACAKAQVLCTTCRHFLDGFEYKESKRRVCGGA